MMMTIKENKRLETDCQLMKCQNNELAQNFLDIQRHVEESDHLNAKVCCFSIMIRLFSFYVYVLIV